MTPRRAVRAIQACLDPALLQPKWRKICSRQRDPGKRRVCGHCYHSAEAAFYLFRGKGYKARVANLGGGKTHWWIEAPGGRRIDPTAGQFDRATLARAYSRGVPIGFLTAKPSARAQKILACVRRRLR